MKVVSRLPGRLRIRGKLLRDAGRNQALADETSGWPGIRQVQGNPATGSLLIHYDPAILPPDQLEQRLIGQSAPTPSPSATPSILKQANRPAKIGLLISMAVTLLALGSNKKLHAAAGAAHVAFLAVHLLHHRKRMLK